jgi:iron complex transport system ATP-binding protein
MARGQTGDATVIPAVVSLHGLVSGRDGIAAHPGASFVIAPGACVCLLGRNGAGKSTLIQTIVGLLEPIAGEMRFGVPNVPTAQRMAYVPQRPVIPQGMSVGEMLTLGAFRLWGERRELPSVADTLARVGLAHHETRLVSELSGGEQQRAMLARALMQRAQLLVLDEPTAHLDLAQRAEVLALLREICAVGTSVLFSSHAPEDAVAVAHEVVLFERERVRCVSAAQITSEDVSTVYGVPVREVVSGTARIFLAA